ncbi:MAG: tetratricopeptide repeat protein, partial [Deltaproteobacteria bacterium]|nr:tetratricopeptide repeat protein [Deltaproteobacteria bacterium]
MKERNGRIILIGVAALALLYGCAVSENYKMGQDLMTQNRWDEAIGYFETAVQEQPGNAQFKSSLQKARQQAAVLHLDKAKQA